MQLRTDRRLDLTGIPQGAPFHRAVLVIAVLRTTVIAGSRASLGWIQAQWAITGSPSDGSRARFGMRNAAITAPTTKNPEPQARVAV
jgi:hypothetical protein